MGKKKRLPLGYLKLWPQDFIVEEITLDGEQTTVFPDKFIHKKRDFLPENAVLYAPLIKCGLSTIEAKGELTKNFKAEPENMKFASIKDKQAIISQLISIKEGDAEKLHQISLPYLFIKNVFSGKKGLSFGSLQGNQFTILIRIGPDFKKEEFQTQLKKTEKKRLL